MIALDIYTDRSNAYVGLIPILSVLPASVVVQRLQPKYDYLDPELRARDGETATASGAAAPGVPRWLMIAIIGLGGVLLLVLVGLSTLLALAEWV
ncbi:hypothetical protein [Microbacterium terricola]|uniref:hypothetical protein n=1 Tax=Microbacterium terricola TaxID=344163 RepID=UPI0021E7E599|nr:hypothetical protein [Microbacterium terricola]UYK39871.1 hypothetical protein OAU46_14420 [Microbacterium terricola]